MDLLYDNPTDLTIQQINTIKYGIEWFDDEKNKETYDKEKNIITGLK
jgi:hypothetical protein